ncbi:hypothetical protein TL16_g02592 [Triparma laevis f. inornata]|uniref:Adenylate kinase n=1 Tax=Triparma laevis f. inornata TaxID=1714386 RepID=A0A9W6ZWF8_9STRA|nr:hypothetical protein TL16_g02592 [Triparma laevis f. inornata]
MGSETASAIEFYLRFSITAEGLKPAPKIIIAGAPASGKGTQCEIIKERYNVVHPSTGDMLRAAVKAGSEVGMKAKAQMEAGELVSDEVIIGVVNERLAQEDWLLDGFPRTRAQADAQAVAGITCDSFVFLKVPDEILVERVVGRRTDPETGKIYHLKFSPPPTKEVEERLTHRADDIEEKVKVRLKAFHENVNSIASCYTEVMFEGVESAEAKYIERAVASGDFTGMDAINELLTSELRQMVEDAKSKGGGGQTAEELKNSLTEAINGFDDLQLGIYNNNFSGNLPPNLDNLSKLTELQLGNNLFTGSLPTSLANLENLTSFHIMGNNFSHNSLPAAFEEMQKQIGNIFSTDWNKNELYLNRANEAIASIKDLQVRAKDYVYDKFGNEVQLADPLFAFQDGTKEHTLIKPRFGPTKGYQCALAKEKEGIAKSGDDWIGLRDLNRVTFEFEDPLILTLVYQALLKKYTVSGLKNKFEWIYTETYEQPPDIHMNLDLSDVESRKPTFQNTMKPVIAASIAAILFAQSALAQDPATGWMAYAVGDISSTGAERITRLEMTWTVGAEPTKSSAFFSPWFGMDPVDNLNLIQPVNPWSGSRFGGGSWSAYTEYYQWSPTHNSNSASFSVKSGDTLKGSLVYDESSDSYTLTQTCVETGDESSQVVKAQNGKKYTVPYVVYEKTFPCADYPADEIVTFRDIVIECDGVECTQDVAWSEMIKDDNCNMAAHVSDNNTEISITWDTTLKSKYDAFTRQELFDMNMHGNWALAMDLDENLLALDGVRLPTPIHPIKCTADLALIAEDVVNGKAAVTKIEEDCDKSRSAECIADLTSFMSVVDTSLGHATTALSDCMDGSGSDCEVEMESVVNTLETVSGELEQVLVDCPSKDIKDCVKDVVASGKTIFAVIGDAVDAFKACKSA